MANIENILSLLKTAIYGRDVRSAIHDSIEAINIENEETKWKQECLGVTFDKLIINAGNSNAELVDARGSFDKLGNRLNDITSKLSKNENSINSLNNHNHNTLYATKESEHTHSNKSALDLIKETDIQSWNAKLAHDPSPEIHFLHPAPNKAGDCTVIKTCEGKWIMIDCGEAGSFYCTKDQLDKLGCGEIEMLFTTHAHSDHIGEAVNIIKTYKPKKIFFKTLEWSKLPPVEVEWGTEAYHNAMLQAGREVGAELINATDTTIPISSKENIKILASGYFNYSDMNHNSLMFLYNFGTFKCLFAGDGTFETEKHVAGKIGVVDVLKSGHHGTGSGTGVEFLAELTPKACIVGGIKGLDSIGAMATLVAQRCKYYGSKVYDMWEINKGGSFKIFNNTFSHSLQESKLGNTFYTVESGTNKGKVVFIKDNGDIACDEIVNYKLDYYFFEGYFMTNGWARLGETYYFAGEDGRIYRNKWVLNESDEFYYYLKLDGLMARNEEIFIDGKIYKFDINGVCVNPTVLPFLPTDEKEEM